VAVKNLHPVNGIQNDYLRAAGSESEYLPGFDTGHLASGVYIYRLQAGSHILIKRMTLIK